MWDREDRCGEEEADRQTDRHVTGDDQATSRTRTLVSRLNNGKGQVVRRQTSRHIDK